MKSSSEIFFLIINYHYFKSNITQINIYTNKVKVQNIDIQHCPELVFKNIKKIIFGPRRFKY